MTPPGTPVAYAVVRAPAGDTQSALERIEQSRHRLREQLLAMRGNGRESDTRSNGAGRPNRLLASLKTMPIAGVLIDAWSGWWAQHPLRAVFTVMAAASATTLAPATRRHPLVSVVAALALGGAVIWARPWRHAALRRVLYAGLLPKLISTVFARLPADGWLSVADSLLGRRPPASAVTGAREQAAAPSGRMPLD